MKFIFKNGYLFIKLISNEGNQLQKEQNPETIFLYLNISLYER